MHKYNMLAHDHPLERGNKRKSGNLVIVCTTLHTTEGISLGREALERLHPSMSLVHMTTLQRRGVKIMQRDGRAESKAGFSQT